MARNINRVWPGHGAGAEDTTWMPTCIHGALPTAQDLPHGASALCMVLPSKKKQQPGSFGVRISSHVVVGEALHILLLI